MSRTKLLKRDVLGTVGLRDDAGVLTIVRSTRDARAGAKWLARRLLHREARALEALGSLAGVPRLLRSNDDELVREYLAGTVLYEGERPSPAFFRSALTVLRRIHSRGVAHNDLAKEANWLHGPEGAASIVDFQLAVVSKRRGRWFRRLAREDLRHLLKHKAYYCEASLTARQRRMLASPSAAARFWRALVKPPYRLVTRGLLGWPERDGPVERS